MRSSDIDKSKPVWALQGPRAFGPFPIHVLGRDHAVVKVPNDKRHWSDTDRVPARLREKTLEIFPVSCLTQDPAEAEAWNERNEPRVGDLVSYKCSKRVWDEALAHHVARRDTTEEGVVVKSTGHQVYVMVGGSSAHMRHGNRRITKDSCIVISRGDASDV